jgi:hypothetical protein
MANPTARPYRGGNRRIADQTLLLGADLLRVIGSEVSLSLASAIDRGDHGVVADASIDPQDYSCPDSFARDYCAVNLLRKSTSLNISVDRERLALEAFLTADQSCATVNAKLSKRFANPSIGLTAESYIHTARRNISKLLGDFDWNAAEAYFSFSTGASTRLPRRKGDAFYKYSGLPETTLSCLPLSIAAVRRIPLWEASLRQLAGEDPRDWFKVVEGSRITTVPKTAKIDRVIAVEPCMNMFIQKGIGKLIRLRLKRVGIDLDDQTLNQRMAASAFKDELATIDLKAASDSISLELVRSLLPPDWFQAMCLCRSEVGILPSGVKHRFAKISSMGNGFTFELESLIFWALCRSVQQLSGGADHRLGVYGDDLIIGRAHAHELIKILGYCGFDCNPEKTFLDGSFFESCGKHYFEGVDVTPVYVKEPIATSSRLLWYLNSIRRWAARPTPGYSDGRYYDHWNRSRNLLPPNLRDPRIPDGYGDGGLIGSFHEVMPAFVRPDKSGRSKQMWQVRVLVDRRQKWRPDGPQACLAFLQGAELRHALSDDYYQIVSREQGRYVEAKAYLSQWSDAPLWCI